MVEVEELFGTDSTQGLTTDQVEEIRSIHGFNKLPNPPRKSVFKILLNQFNDILIYILIIAALITLVLAFVDNPNDFSLSYFFDTIVIIVVLIVNAGIGFYQEIKAEKAVQSLQTLVSEFATVFRDGKMKILDAKELVPGDILEINAGERVPADIRLYSTKQLTVNESALTGESLVASKNSALSIEPNASLGDQRNMAFMGTIVASGKGKGVVIATGRNTEVGKISEMVANIGNIQTPLQKKLEEFSTMLAKLIIIVSTFLIVFGSFVEFLNVGLTENLVESILGLTIVGVSLAVAAIPEGLPIILTFTLAISVQKMAQQNAIIRNLDAVETLGSTTIIASDKTGTLTQNKLSLVGITDINDSYNLKEINLVNELPSIQKIQEIMKSTTIALDVLELNGPTHHQVVDPLDLAIYESILSVDSIFPITPESIRSEFPFDSDRKMMSVIIKSNLSDQLHLKGAPDVVISKATHLLDQNGESIAIDETYRYGWLRKLDNLAEQGYRVIGCAYRDLEENYIEDQKVLEDNLVFVGFLSFIDPPRKEVYEALTKCYNAGIDVMMITGDHPRTALTIAKQLGIANQNSTVLTGIDIDQLSDEELLSTIETIRVFARVSPAHKLRLVTLLKEKGEIVAMTGDGINDSPALVKSDIGVAMGIAGTDAAKEASDMILLDDNFATLVEAVEEGRVVNTNIRKFTNYLLASNSSEVGLLIFGFFIIAALQPLLIRNLIPLSETQILYLNLVTDSFLALALGLEKKETSVMKQPPLHPNTPIVTRSDAKKIGLIGLGLALASTAIFITMLGNPQDWDNLTHLEIVHAQSFTLTFLVLSEVFIALSYRSSQRIHNIGFFTNRFFVISVLVIVLAQVAILYIPLFNALFDTSALSLIDWLIIVVLSTLVFVGIELTKDSA